MTLQLFATFLLFMTLLYKYSCTETYKHMGCYLSIDHSNRLHGPAMQKLGTSLKKNGLHFCGKICSDRRLAYVGLQKQRCFCGGPDFNRYGEASDLECLEPCPDSANGANYCGGDDTYSVYFIQNMPGENVTRPAKVQDFFIVTSVTDNRYWEGDLITLKCIAFGKPLPSLEWRTPSIRLIDYAQLAPQERKKSGIMAMNRMFVAKRNLNNKPMVCAALQNDTIMDSQSLNVTIFFTPQNIQISFQMQSNSTDNTHCLAITCRVQESNPAPLIQWKVLDAKKKLHNLKNFHVAIKIVQEEHRGKNGGRLTTSTVRVTDFQAFYNHQFRCTALQPDGRQLQNTSSVLTKFSVISESAKIDYPKMPYFEHQNVTFLCKIYNMNLDVSIEWWLHDSISGLTERIKVGSHRKRIQNNKLREQTITLDLMVSRYYHNKRIGCFITQNKSVYSAVSKPLIIFNLPRVVIRGGARFFKEAELVESENGRLVFPQEAQDTSLQCIAEQGFPAFGYIYHWITPPLVKLTSNKDVLHLGDVSVNQEGWYECIVQTLAGETGSSVFLQVKQFN